MIVVFSLDGIYSINFTVSTSLHHSDNYYALLRKIRYPILKLNCTFFITIILLIKPSKIWVKNLENSFPTKLVDPMAKCWIYLCVIGYECRFGQILFMFCLPKCSAVFPCSKTFFHFSFFHLSISTFTLCVNGLRVLNFNWGV